MRALPGVALVGPLILCLAASCRGSGTTALMTVTESFSLRAIGGQLLPAVVPSAAGQAQIVVLTDTLVIDWGRNLYQRRQNLRRTDAGGGTADVRVVTTPAALTNANGALTFGRFSHDSSATATLLARSIVLYAPDRMRWDYDYAGFGTFAVVPRWLELAASRPARVPLPLNTRGSS